MIPTFYGRDFSRGSRHVIIDNITQVVCIYMTQEGFMIGTREQRGLVIAAVCHERNNEMTPRRSPIKLGLQ